MNTLSITKQELVAILMTKIDERAEKEKEIT